MPDNKSRRASDNLCKALVILKDTGVAVPDQYQDGAAFLRYNVVRLWEQNPQEILAHEGLMPLAVLCHTDEPGGHLLQTVAAHIASLDSLTERREKRL